MKLLVDLKAGELSNEMRLADAITGEIVGSCRCEPIEDDYINISFDFNPEITAQLDEISPYTLKWVWKASTRGQQIEMEFT